MGLEIERLQRVFPGDDSDCRCRSLPIYEENGVRVGKDHFERNVTITTLLIGLAIVSMVIFFSR